MGGFLRRNLRKKGLAEAIDLLVNRESRVRRDYLEIGGLQAGGSEVVGLDISEIVSVRQQARNEFSHHLVSSPEGDPLVCVHELSVGVLVAALCSFDELRF